jgi:hypothetical protein
MAIAQGQIDYILVTFERKLNEKLAKFSSSLPGRVH